MSPLKKNLIYPIRNYSFIHYGPGNIHAGFMVFHIFIAVILNY